MQVATDKTSIRATGFKYLSNMPCYWRLDSNLTDAKYSDQFEVTVDFSFVAKIRLYSGSAREFVSNETTANMEETYYFPVVENGYPITLWVLALPDN